MGTVIGTGIGIQKKVQQGSNENLDDILFYTDPDDGLNYDLTFTDVDTLEYYLQLIEA